MRHIYHSDIPVSQGDAAVAGVRPRFRPARGIAYRATPLPMASDRTKL
jgi:hypothetical protein